MYRELKEANFVETAWNDDCLSIVIGPKVVGAAFKNMCIISKKKKKFVQSLNRTPHKPEDIFYIQFNSTHFSQVKNITSAPLNKNTTLLVFKNFYLTVIFRLYVNIKHINANYCDMIETEKGSKVNANLWQDTFCIARPKISKQSISTKN